MKLAQKPPMKLALKPPHPALILSVMLVKDLDCVPVVEPEAGLEAEAEAEAEAEEDEHHPTLQTNLYVEDEAEPEDAVVVGNLLHLEVAY